MLHAYGHAIGESAVAWIAAMRADDADKLSGMGFNFKVEGVVFAVSRRRLLGPTPSRLARLRKRHMIELAHHLAILIPDEVSIRIGRLNGAQPHALPLPNATAIHQNFAGDY